MATKERSQNLACFTFHFDKGSIGNVLTLTTPSCCTTGARIGLIDWHAGVCLNIAKNRYISIRISPAWASRNRDSVWGCTRTVQYRQWRCVAREDLCGMQPDCFSGSVPLSVLLTPGVDLADWDFRWIFQWVCLRGMNSFVMSWILWKACSVVRGYLTLEMVRISCKLWSTACILVWCRYSCAAFIQASKLKRSKVQQKPIGWKIVWKGLIQTPKHFCIAR